MNHKQLLRGLAALACLSVAGLSRAEVLVLDETFDDADRFVSDQPFFSDGVDDYLGIAGGAASDFGEGTEPSGLKSYAGFDGGYLTAQDLDGDPGLGPQAVLSWTGLDVAGLTDLRVSARLAEFFDEPGDIDASDYLRVEASLDGGGFQTFLEFRGADTNTRFRLDEDGDGIGEGVASTAQGEVFQVPLAATGSSLDLRLTLRLNSGDEDVAVDDLRLVGVPAEARGDLSISKTDHRRAAVVGEALEYEILVLNEGTTDVVGASVIDQLPPELLGASARWTCEATGAASCSAEGVGDLVDTVDLPVGQSVRYRLAATLDSFGQGVAVSNTATVEMPEGLVDATPGDNSATDITMDDRILASGFE